MERTIKNIVDDLFDIAAKATEYKDTATLTEFTITPRYNGNDLRSLTIPIVDPIRVKTITVPKRASQKLHGLRQRPLQR